MKSTGENRQLGEKPVPVPLCPPQISHGLDPGSNPGLCGERPATNRLSHGTATNLISLNITVLWDVQPCNLGDKYQSSKGICYIRLQDR
jgi:hypothetical protein